jgi:arylsulfatase A-like enzyme
VPTLATTLSPHGYDTAAFVNHFYVGAHFGFQRGFARFEYVESDYSQRGAAPGIVDAALAWLDQPRDERFFLFLHFFDVHSDYRSRPEIEALFAEQRGPEDGTAKQIMGLAALASPSAEAVALLSQLYDAGIRQLDQDLGRFLDAFEQSGRSSDTILVVTSDHGEEFGEHGGVSHGRTHYEEVLRVPLLMRGPGLPAGVRIDTAVSLVDVAPTLLDLLGIRPDGALDGRSLRPLWEGTGATDEEPRAVFAEAAPAPEGDQLVSVRMGPYKLVVDESDGSRALYDLSIDAGEGEDVAADHPDLVDRLSRRVAEHRAARRAGRPVLPLTAERRAQLRALGYAAE